MSEKLSDAEILATFMEPKPERTSANIPLAATNWWVWKWSAKGQQYRAWPNDDMLGSLDSLRLVEARLSDEQWMAYLAALAGTGDPFRLSVMRAAVHASAEQKSAALAEMLRAAFPEAK